MATRGRFVTVQLVKHQGSSHYLHGIKGLSRNRSYWCLQVQGRYARSIRLGVILGEDGQGLAETFWAAINWGPEKHDKPLGIFLDWLEENTHLIRGLTKTQVAAACQQVRVRGAWFCD